MTQKIILASTSPRRRDLLKQVGVDFVVCGVDIDETPKQNEDAPTYVARMAYEKSLVAQANLRANDIIITADTIGHINGHILTKPNDKADAFAMWQQMSDNTHEVITAVCVNLGDVRLSQQVITKVKFIALDNQAMSDYWATGEPVDKAGAYAIQGKGAAWVKAIYGSYANVVGLPLVETLAMIKQVQNTC